MNAGQNALLDWLWAGLKIPGVRAGDGDGRYLLSNMIAKYSLCADEYRLSGGALAQLNSSGVDLAAVYKRSRFYGRKRPFIYEHPIPAGVTLAHLLDQSERSLSRFGLEAVLEFTSPACVLTREEDRQLTTKGLGRRMPKDWAWGATPFARYDEAEVVLSDRVLRVCGAICR